MALLAGIVSARDTGRGCEMELAQSDAFVVAWLPGSEGAGIGEALFAAQPEGEALFPGRLPFAWPRDGGAPQWQDDEQLNVRFPRGYPWPR